MNRSRAGLVFVLSISGIASACSASEGSSPLDAGLDAADAMSATDAADARFGECKSACEVHIRPHLIVGLFPDDARAADVHLTLRGTAGGIKPGERGTGECPAEFPAASCSFSFGTIPSDVRVQLILEDGAEPPVTFEVTVGAFNHCSRDITYVPLHRADAGSGWTQGETRYVSPCDTL